MKLPLVSCIVPVLNGERYLREALDSILAQTYRPMEIIVADDGSTDGTAALVADYGGQVRYLFQQNAGTAAACNLGLKAAQGDFIAFLAADDLWHPERLARQISRFQLRPDLDLCVTYVQNFWIPELREEAERFRNHRISQPLPGYVPQTLLARRALFETVGHFNIALRHADSTDWFLRVIEHGAVIDILPDVLVYRRIHQSNLSRRMASASRQEYVELVKATLDRRRRHVAACLESSLSVQKDN
jgi:glycosyltransferase involved in cell wall biosynthesis